MANNTVPMADINKAIAQLKGPYNYQKTGEFLNKLSDKTQEALHRTSTEVIEKNLGKKEKTIS